MSRITEDFSNAVLARRFLPRQSGQGEPDCFNRKKLGFAMTSKVRPSHASCYMGEENSRRSNVVFRDQINEIAALKRARNDRFSFLRSLNRRIRL